MLAIRCDDVGQLGRQHVWTDSLGGLVMCMRAVLPGRGAAAGCHGLRRRGLLIILAAELLRGVRQHVVQHVVCAHPER